MYNSGGSDDMFRQKFEDFAPKPSDRIWDNLQSSLPVPRPFYKRPPFWMASLSLLLLLGGLSYFFSQYDLQIALVKQDQSLAQVSDKLVKESHTITKAIEQNASSSLVDSNNTTGTKNAKQSHTDIDINSDQPVKSSRAATNNTTTSEASKEKWSPALALRKNRIQKKLLISANRAANAGTLSQDYLREDENAQSNIIPPMQVEGASLQSIQQQSQGTETAAIGMLPVLSLSSVTGTNLDEGIPVYKSTDRQFGGPFANLKGLSFGVTYAVNNTWLLNNKDNLQTPTGTLEYRLDFGPAYGFTLGYTFNPNWGVQLDWVVNSNQGQKWSNQYGNYISYKENNLTYSHFPLLLKYKRAKESKLTKKPFVLNYIVGVQYSRLKSAEINVDNGLARDLLKKTDWGLVIGFDYDLYLNKDFFFTVGTRSSLAASNNPMAIFSNKKDEARNFLMGVQASLHYKFSK